MFLDRILEPIRNKIILMVAKAVINRVIDTEGIQTLQVDFGNDELIDGVERVQNFGFTSHPEDGGQAIVLCIGGTREHPVVIAVDEGKYRPALAKGESAMYNAGGMLIKLTSGGFIDLQKGSTPLTPLDGVVTGACIDPFTGSPFPDKSLIVRAQKL